jgi:hypothetical protein
MTTWRHRRTTGRVVRSRIADFVAGPFQSIERVQSQERRRLAKWKLLDAVTWKLFNAD